MFAALNEFVDSTVPITVYASSVFVDNRKYNKREKNGTMTSTANTVFIRKYTQPAFPINENAFEYQDDDDMTFIYINNKEN